MNNKKVKEVAFIAVLTLFVMALTAFSTAGCGGNDFLFDQDNVGWDAGDGGEGGVNDGGGGGTAGDGGTGGVNTGGTGGTGGTSQGGDGGTGGSGGTGVPTCNNAGDTGTVDTITAAGALQRSLFFWFNDGSTMYFDSLSSTEIITGKPLPGMMVFVAEAGGSYNLANGATPISQMQYDFTTLPPACAGLTLTSEACGEAIAKAWRCQNAPYNETVGCPPAVTFHNSSNSDSYQDFTPGWKLRFVHLDCP